MGTLIDQIKKRRKALGLRQADMNIKIGMNRQQYQRIESRGNPRLETLELIAAGLNCELILVPCDRVFDVKAALGEKQLCDDPWRGLLPDD